MLSSESSMSALVCESSGLSTSSVEHNSEAESVNQCQPARRESRPEQYVIYKSLNYLPFTTRFKMLQQGSAMRMVDANPRQSVVVTDSRAPEHSCKQR